MADTRSRGNVSERSLDPRGKEAIEKILKKHSRDILLDTQVISELRKTLSDSKLVDTVFDYYKQRLELIKNKVNKFKKALLMKYPNLTPTELLHKAKKYSNKYDLSDGEFQMFVTLLSSDPTTQQHGWYNIPTTPMSKTLGYNTSIVTGDKLDIKEGDLPHFQTIMTLERETRQLHNRLIMQSLTYNDCAPEALMGQFSPDKHNPFNYVHPVIAAMFLPKVPLLDERIIIASIANLIKCKQEGKPIAIQPEFDLYWDLITDPNQRVCSNDPSKTMEDLKNRVVLQTKLWDTIMKLRMGRYYADDMAGFLSAIETCSNGLFDAPDLVYTHDEGTVLRRILNAFSLRPTVVTVSSMVNSPIQLTQLSISPASFTQVTTVPMINLRLPHQANVPTSSINIHLNASLNQSQWFVDGKHIVPKTQSIIFSRDVMFFYIDRRYKAYNYASMVSPNKYVFAGLPPAITGLDSLNDMNVGYDEYITLGPKNEDYTLRSVVFVQTTNVNPSGTSPDNVITGCTTGIVKIDPKQINPTEYILYNPQEAGMRINQNGSYVNPPPIGVLQQNANNSQSFDYLAKKFGTIFMYAKNH